VGREILSVKAKIAAIGFLLEIKGYMKGNINIL